MVFINDTLGTYMLYSDLIKEWWVIEENGEEKLYHDLDTFHRRRLDRSPHLHLLPKYSRLSPEPSVIECEEACSDLTHIDHRSILQGYIGSTISDSIYPSHVCKIESTLEVKWL